MDLTDLAYTAGRTVVVYFFVLVIVRLLGKRTVSLGKLRSREELDRYAV